MTNADISLVLTCDITYEYQSSTSTPPPPHRLMTDIKHQPERIFWLTFDIKHKPGGCWLKTDIHTLGFLCISGYVDSIKGI